MVTNDDLEGKRSHFTGFYTHTISRPKIPKPTIVALFTSCLMDGSRDEWMCHRFAKNADFGEVDLTDHSDLDCRKVSKKDFKTSFLGQEYLIA